MKPETIIRNEVPGWTEAEARTIIAALDAIGYIIVPKQPTEKIIQAGYARYGSQDIISSDDWMAEIYRAMIGACQ